MVGTGQFLREIVDSGVTPELGHLDAKHVRAVNVVAGIAAVTFAAWTVFQLTLGDLLVGIENLLLTLGFVGSIALNRRRSYAAAARLLALLSCLQTWLATLLFGFAAGPPAYWACVAVAPYLVFMRSRRAEAHAWAAVATLSGVAAVVLADHLPARLVVGDLDVLWRLNVAAVLATLVLEVAFFARFVDSTEDALADARARTRDLLHNVLPDSIADRLEAFPEEVIADRFGEVTVLFADLVGFTPMSARLSPEATVELLNRVFSGFDAICREEGAEKIKTIGDGYMAACGAPQRRDDHAEVMVRVARRIRDFVADDPRCEGLQVRIGLNTGEAVGAIVGTSRFHYDLWSDGVNVAARMESTGEPGRIQLARGTWERVRDRHRCEARGTIDVKGKGEMQTWFLE